jgi:hypothetical protein
MSYEIIKSKVMNCLTTYPDKTVHGISRRVHGSAAGIPFEEWVVNALKSCKLNAFLQEGFVEYVVKELRELGFSSFIENIVFEKTWWGSYVVSESQLKAALINEKPTVYQQSLADVIVFYGSDVTRDLNDVLIINVKSHDVSKLSRPPNIISALRVLEFGKDLLTKAQYYPDFIDKANIIFVGIYYSIKDNIGRIVDIYVKDFFKLDVNKMPPINFDAAIQIQWHVRDMVENSTIDRITFLENLAKKYLIEWQKFMRERTKDIENLINELNNLIEVYRKQRLKLK